MAIKVHFVGGGEVVLNDETLGGLQASLSEGGWAHYPQDNALVVLANVAYAEDVDADMPEVEESSY